MLYVLLFPLPDTVALDGEVPEHKLLGADADDLVFVPAVGQLYAQIAVLELPLAGAAELLTIFILGCGVGAVPFDCDNHTSAVVIIKKLPCAYKVASSNLARRDGFQLRSIVAFT